MNSTTLSARPPKQPLFVFGLLWLLTFILYLPAAKAGWVIDTVGFVYHLKHQSFLDFINNTQSEVPSLYQFTQFTTYLFYKLFHTNPYAWHFLMVTMHAVNAFLVFIIFRRLFDDSGMTRSTFIALSGVVIYTICPHISEVIVWEASYHYLQGFLLILLILLWVQRFHHNPAPKYAVWAGLLYLVSTYSLEIFYLTPWFVLTLAMYYRFALGYDSRIWKRVITWFFIPQLLMFVLHLVVLSVAYGHFAHIAENVWQPFATYISKPPRYLFHVLFLGRYFPQDIRKQVYQAVSSNAGLIIFYNIIVLICCSIFFNFSTMRTKGKAASLLFVWIIIGVIILMPLAFPESLLMFFDRYTYFLDAFTYMLLALLVSYIANRFVGVALLLVYGLINIFFTIKVNLYWKYATYIDNRLLKELPDPGNKTIILLNFPENLNGVPMIGAQPKSMYKMMRETIANIDMPNKVYDVASYNMITKDDGAHITVSNDSTLHVTLNQWGTWWWYEGHGGHSYETPDYKVNMVDPGHWYEITLKHPHDQYLLLYNVGDRWKVVDMKKRNEDQY